MNTTQSFWSHFKEVQKSLEDSDSDALRSLYLCLTKVDDRLYLHTGQKDNGFDLILSAEGIPELLPILDRLAESAPILDGWSYITCYDGDFVFGGRNDELYPNDINGGVLYKMVSQGDRPWIERDVDFSVVFPDRKAADDFISEFDTDYSNGNVEPYDGAEGYTYQVSLTKFMHPTYKGISTFEESISLVAERFGGRNDGWGCFTIDK